MSDHQFVVTDVDYQPYKHEEVVAGTIRPEDIKEENIFLLTPADVTDFQSPPANFQIVEDIANFQENNFNIQAFTNALNGESFTKLPVDLGSSYKFEPVKSNKSSHFIKYKIHDGKHTKVWECGICSKEFGHQYTLMRHLPTHTDERKFQCNTCGKAFRQMSTLSQHRAIHSAERPYNCEVCQKTFNRVSTLISHRKTHTGQKPHQCHLCNKAFHQKGNLRNHIFTHTNERPYKCDICDKGFNQMSNLMCHKLKAHQRVDKPKHTCHICGKDFQKRMGLRNHEQYQHGLQVSEPSTSSSESPRIRYTNGVLVDPINTAAMQHALATNQTPFALLRPSNGIPVLVRVLPAGDKQMLVPATAEDLKKHGQISISPKTENGENETQADLKDPLQSDASVAVKPEVGGAPVGSTVQIKIPVVATVVQRCGKDGNVCMAVQSPGPDNDGSGSNCVFTTTGDEVQLTEGNQENDDLIDALNPVESEQRAAVQNLLPEAQIDFIDESGNIIPEDDFNRASRYFQQNFGFGADSSVFDRTLPLDGPLGMHENQGNIEPSVLREIDPETILNMDNGTNLQIFNLLEDAFLDVPFSLIDFVRIIQMLEKTQSLALDDHNGNDLYKHLDPNDYVFN